MIFLIRNFRSIKELSLQLAPITILYGQNGAGKSSFLYALLTLKNAVLNSNQRSDAFFNLSFANLGGFQAVVHDHKRASRIELGVSLSQHDSRLTYLV